MDSILHSLDFQCKDILGRDKFIRTDDDKSYDSDEHANSVASRHYQILIFGLTAAGQSVCLQVDKFRPFFFIRIPDVIRDDKVAFLHFKEWVSNAIPLEVKSYVDLTKEFHKTLFDYNQGVESAFLKITVPSQALWRKLKDKFLNKSCVPIEYEMKSLFGAEALEMLQTGVVVGSDVESMSADKTRLALKVYEANIDPMLRFFHIQNVSPAGWIHIDAGKWDETESDELSTTITASADYEDIHPGNGGVVAPYLIGSWDIECFSSHGDFPQAQKTWRKPVRELLESSTKITTVDALCKTLAMGIQAKSKVISPIYLKDKMDRSMNAETLRGRIEMYRKVKDVANALTALYACRTSGVANTTTVTSATVGIKDTLQSTLTFGKDSSDDDDEEPVHVSGRDAKDKAIAVLDELLTECLPRIAGDEVIQIGTVLYRNGKALSKHIWVLDGADESAVKPPGADVPIHVYSYTSELDMISDWFYWIGKEAPDILIGYNIFGFDSKYVWDRLLELLHNSDIQSKTAAAKRTAKALLNAKQYGSRKDIDEATKSAKLAASAKAAAEAKALRSTIGSLSCLKSKPPRLDEKFLSSSAMGDNTMWILSSPGRLQIDLLPYVRRNHNLESYTLDNVSATFVSGSINGILKVVEGEVDTFTFSTKSTKGIVEGRFITLLDMENDRVVDRCRVVGVEPKSLKVVIEGGKETLAEHGAAPVRWAQVKDDISPKDIFRLHKFTGVAGMKGRADIARYCLQDCDLVMELFTKLEILNNSIAMADVCSVPVGFIFTRGQGIKIESLIFKECRKGKQLIPVLPSAPRGEEVYLDEDKEADEDSYEGAIVLEPHTGIYIDDPVTANDFSSLYPSSIISENISHDTLISVKDYDNDGRFLCIREGSDTYDNLPGKSYVNVEFDILRSDPGDTRKHKPKSCAGKRVARYVQDEQGTIPRILKMLLDSRKSTRKLAEKEPDEFRKALLDAQQLAYKLTANSLYGQLGSGTFKIRRQVLAASTTGYGRKQLMFAKEVMEEVYSGGKDPRCDLECVYGDTDSIFLRFRPRDPATGEPLRGMAALVAAKELTIESGKLVSSCLKAPHDFEFDKIFKSFCLLSKKRYVGDMSEDGLEDDDFHRKSMGIVMKRRDNAPIVKYIYGGAIDRLLATTDTVTGVTEAVKFIQDSACDLLAGKFPLTKLTITKSLRSEYADPTRIAHKVLAERIGERDPGNKPSTSDRIPFVYIKHVGSGPPPKLQGDRIEHPSYIKEHELVPDYSFYITNQIAKPVSQVFGLQVERIPGVTAAAVASAAKARDPVAAREKLAESLLFGKLLLDASRTAEAMEARGQRSIASMFASQGVKV
jgi:DNA polymerase elongation subunit (family B)